MSCPCPSGCDNPGCDKVRIRQPENSSDTAAALAALNVTLKGLVAQLREMNENLRELEEKRQHGGERG